MRVFLRLSFVLSFLSSGTPAFATDFWPIEVSGMSEFCLSFVADLQAARTYAEQRNLTVPAFEYQGQDYARVMFCNDHSNQAGSEFDESILGLFVEGPSGSGMYVPKTYSPNIQNSMLARHVFRSAHEIAKIQAQISATSAKVEIRAVSGAFIARMTWNDAGSVEESQRYQGNVYSPRSSGWFGLVPFSYPFIVEGVYHLAEYAASSHSFLFGSGTPWDELIQELGPLTPIRSQASDQQINYKMGLPRPYAIRF